MAGYYGNIFLTVNFLEASVSTSMLERIEINNNNANNG